MLKGTAMQRPVPAPAMETSGKWPLASTATHSLPDFHPKLEFAKVSLDRETLHGSPLEDKNAQVTRLSDVTAKEQVLL